MHVTVGIDGWYLCDGLDPADREDFEFLGRGEFARQWVNQFRDDLFALATLRRLLGGGAALRSNDQVMREVAARLTSREWIARRRLIKRVSTAGVPESAGAPPAPAVRRQPAATPPPASADPPLFPADIDALAIAEGQKQAAALGIPFCEECLRAQLAANR